MAYIMTKRGSQDNVVTYEFMCDTAADMNAIENKYRTLGSVAIVLSGESEQLEVYITGSDKEWKSLANIGGGGSNAPSGLSLYICSQNEVSNGLPDVEEPDETILYLVAASNESNNLYEEYVWTGDGWEKFGGASIDLSNYATLNDIAGFYTKPQGGIPAADLAETYLTQHQDISGKANSADLATVATSGSYNDLSNKPDLSIYAPKDSPVFTNSISMGRKENTLIGHNSVAIGDDITATGAYSHAEGSNTTASGPYSHAEGYYTLSSGTNAHAEGYYVIASGYCAHAEGQAVTASESYSHAEGSDTIASGSNSHAEGYGGTYTLNGITYTSEAKGMADHTEGYQTRTAFGQPGNHAEGYQTAATGGAAHAEGYYNIASGSQSHAEGVQTVASGPISHTENEFTIATARSSHVSGKFNVADSYTSWPEWTANTHYRVGDKVKLTVITNNGTTVTGYVCKVDNYDPSFTASRWTKDQYINYAVITGNGTSDNARSNAYALDWSGNEYLKGNLYVECDADSVNGSKVATEAFVTTRVPTPPVVDGTYNLQVSVSSGTATYSWVTAPGSASGVNF